MVDLYSNEYLSLNEIVYDHELRKQILHPEDKQAQEVALPLFKAGVLSIGVFCEVRENHTLNPGNHILRIHLQGKVKVKRENQEYSIKPGDLVCTPFGEKTQWRVKKGDMISFIQIKLKKTPLWEPIKDGGFSIIPEYSTDLFYVYTKRLLKAYYGDENFPKSSALGDANALSNLIRRIRNRNFQMPYEPESDLNKLIKAIRHSPEKDWTLTKMAELCHISPRSLNRACHSRLGLSPVQLVIQQRIQRGKQLLLGTEKTVSAISELVGYQSLQSFTRLFQKHTNYTPGKYRQVFGGDEEVANEAG